MKQLALITTVVLTSSLSWADAAPNASEEVLAHYEEAFQKQQETMKGLAMDVTMEASIPKLKKKGKMNALRMISSLGRVTYKQLGFSGDDTVKKEVMARYMSAEVDPGHTRSGDIAITPANYHFKFKGLNERSGQQVYIFELKPKTKRVGLFKGELWIDPSTYLPVREQGRFVKSPSVFIKKVDFVRNYEIRDGIAYLTHLESKTDTRIVGVAELNIDYANYHPQLDSPGTEPVDEAATP